MIDFVEYILGESISQDFYPVLIVCAVFFALYATILFIEFLKALFGVNI